MESCCLVVVNCFYLGADILNLHPLEIDSQIVAETQPTQGAGKGLCRKKRNMEDSLRALEALDVDRISFFIAIVSIVLANPGASFALSTR
ncbi:hypothetical protein V2G26_018171 [Clonostachys chloroleuca]